MKTVLAIKLRSNKELPFEAPTPDNPYWNLDAFYGEDITPKDIEANLHKIDFTTISNEAVRSEIMLWLFHVVTDKEISKKVLSEHIKQIETLSTYLSLYFPKLLSILEINAAEFIPSYEQWLQDIERSNAPVRVYQVNGDMKKVIYEYDGVCTTYFKRIYKFLAELCDPSSLLPEKNKDKWDIRNLPFPVEIMPSRPRYTVSFEKISQNWLKKLVKDYSYIRLRTKKYSTVIDDLKAFNLFSAFLQESTNSSHSAEDITREDIENYIEYVNKQNFAPTSHNQRIAGVIRLFNYAMMQGENVNCSMLFYGMNYARQVNLDPIYFTDNEIRQINSCMDEYPELVRLFLILIESIGGRISDVCQIKIKGALTKNPKGDYTLHYDQQKSNKPRVIPVEPEIAGVIVKAIEISRKKYGDDCVYVFAKSPDMPISQDSISRYLNYISYKHHFVTDDGTPLRIQSHAFRRTKATRMAALGMSLHQIMVYLGQSTPSVLKRYINVYAIDDQDVLGPYLEDKNRKISNIGAEKKVQHISDPNVEVIPLFNGGCQRSWSIEPCQHDGNFCYKCLMFVPNPLDLPAYMEQLDRLNAKLTLAMMNNKQLVIPRIKEDIGALEAVIKACQQQ